MCIHTCKHISNTHPYTSTHMCVAFQQNTHSCAPDMHIAAVVAAHPSRHGGSSRTSSSTPPQTGGCKSSAVHLPPHVAGGGAVKQANSAHGMAQDLGPGGSRLDHTQLHRPPMTPAPAHHPTLASVSRWCVDVDRSTATLMVGFPHQRHTPI